LFSFSFLESTGGDGTKADKPTKPRAPAKSRTKTQLSSSSSTQQQQQQPPLPGGSQQQQQSSYLSQPPFGQPPHQQQHQQQSSSHSLPFQTNSNSANANANYPSHQHNVNFSPDQYSNSISGGGGGLNNNNSSFSPSKAFPSSNNNNPSSPLDPNYILANKSESVDLLDFDRHDSFLDDPSLDHYLMDGGVKKVSLLNISID
jgi:hypothetical protein